MLESLVAVLPAAAQPYAKAIAAALVAALTIVAAVSDAPTWLPVVLSLLTPAAVYATPRLDPAPAVEPESNAGA